MSYGYKADYQLDKVKILENYNTIKTNEFNLEDIESLMDQLYLGVNAFDLYLIKQFIQHNNIKSVVELGAGSSSIFFDKLGLKRTSFSQSSQEYKVSFKSVNIYDATEEISLALKDADLLFVDAEHSARFAEFYFSTLMQLGKPVIIHDWFLPNETTWEEQSKLLELGILEKYQFVIVSRILCTEIFKNSNIPPCTILLKK